MISQHGEFPVELGWSFRVILGTEIQDDTLNTCASLFSSHYGVWGEQAETVSRFTKPGQRIKMTPARLRAQYIGVPDKTVLSICMKDEKIVGHAFATVWEYEGGVVGWVTQLVVDKAFRRQHVATTILRSFKNHPLFENVSVVGIASSQPASCDVLTKYANIQIGSIDLSFIRANAAKIIEATNVEYLKSAKVRGNLFQDGSDDGAISSVFTNFFVDHAEPLDVLKHYKSQKGWCLDGDRSLVFANT